jgi:hypothetical protein
LSSILARVVVSYRICSCMVVMGANNPVKNTAWKNQVLELSYYDDVTVLKAVVKSTRRHLT